VPAFVPYAVFHLLLQETVTIRYALPLVPPIVWLATMALQFTGRVSVLAWGAVAASAVIVSVPTAIDYGEQAHPAFRAIVDMISEGEAVPPAGTYSHYALYRSLQRPRPNGCTRCRRSARGNGSGPSSSFARGRADRVVPWRPAAHRHGAVRSG
jgi:hypothetical protein